MQDESSKDTKCSTIAYNQHEVRCFCNGMGHFSMEWILLDTMNIKQITDIETIEYGHFNWIAFGTLWISILSTLACVTCCCSNVDDVKFFIFHFFFWKQN